MKFLRSFFFRPRVVCAWCNRLIRRAGVFSFRAPVSHGICGRCTAEFIRPLAAPRTRERV